MGERLVIRGGNELNGTVEIGGAKNSLVAIIPSAIITKSIVILDNVTPIEDTYTLISILNKLNVYTLYDDKSILYIDARNVKNVKLDMEEMGKLRASYYFMGSLLSMYKSVWTKGPGGCNFGDRPIDLHLLAFNSLGYSYTYENGVYHFIKSKTRNSEIAFDKVSVGATINAILASVKVKGKIIIRNCALEPEIDDLICFLNSCGAKIKRIGIDIEIEGVNTFHGTNYKIMSDRIEAGTFLIIGSAMSNNLCIKNIEFSHVQSVIDVLYKIGADVRKNDKDIIVKKGNNYRGIDVVVGPYPGFPTDLQQPLSVLLSICNNQSTIRETIYPTRLSHIDSLNKMGADISIDGDLIKIKGNRNFKGCNVDGKDLRGGISLVVAALISEGLSSISGVKYIKRGYSNLINKLKKIGANIYLERNDQNE